MKLAHDAIKSKDAQAKIVLGGMLGNGQPFAWDFLKGLYKVPGFKNNFDVAALHPYTGYLDGFRRQILQFRGVMTNHGDSATPLWLTEFGWGSRAPDRFGINKGLAGQAQMLRDSFEMLLAHRKAWNVQRLYWFLWRDPPPLPGGGGCSFCDSAGLLRNNRNPKPAFRRVQELRDRVGPAPGEHHRGASPGRLHQGLHPELLVQIERARLHLHLPGRRTPLQAL